MAKNGRKGVKTRTTCRIKKQIIYVIEKILDIQFKLAVMAAYEENETIFLFTS